MRDIQTRDDIQVLVDSFYGRVRTDALLAPVFAHVDWPHHLPVMYNFWSSMLLGDRSYAGNPFQKHIGLAIDHAHFAQWLVLFKATVHEHFEGAMATEAISRAESIAGLFQHKLREY